MSPVRFLVPGSAALAALALASGLLAAPPKADEVGNPQITAAEIKAHVRYLASEELEGRGSGTRGNDLAAEYLAERFRVAGLKPAGENGTFFQTFPVFTGVRLGADNRLSFQAGKTAHSFKVGQDFFPLGFTKNGFAQAPLVFAGYGISAPNLGYDDYKGLDVRGKIVVVFRHTPDLDDNGKFAPYALLTYKTMTARDKGAAGILLVTGPLSDRPEEFGELSVASASTDCGIPAAFVKRAAIDRLLPPDGKNLRDLQVMIAHGKTQSFPFPNTRAGMRVEVERQTAPTRNVLAYLEGSDPKLKDQVVVIGAHYDHLGHGGSHSLSDSAKPAIHHGADDNASGTAGLMELAHYFASHREKLGRSLLFMGFSGEEMGLLGSNHWTKQPTIPLERVAAMVNMDMIGRLRNDSLYVINAGSSPAWRGLLEQANAGHGLQLKIGAEGGPRMGGSDDQSFYAREIPVLFFFTNIHTDYHRPSDTWDKVNAEGEEKVLGLVADVVGRISRMEQRPPFTKAKEEEQQSPGGGGFRVYLGTLPDYAEQVEGVMLQGVREGSPAEKAGIKAGDIIVGFDGKTIRNVQEYTAVLGGAVPNKPVKIVVVRKGERLTLNITPAGRRN